MRQWSVELAAGGDPQPPMFRQARCGQHCQPRAIGREGSAARGYSIALRGVLGGYFGRRSLQLARARIPGRRPIPAIQHVDRGPTCTCLSSVISKLEAACPPKTSRASGRRDQLVEGQRWPASSDTTSDVRGLSQPKQTHERDRVRQHARHQRAREKPTSVELFPAL